MVSATPYSRHGQSCSPTQPNYSEHLQYSRALGYKDEENVESALKEPEVERERRTPNHNSMASVNPNFKESALLSPPTSLIWSLEKKKIPS